jgi:protein-tyrosine-phosphatase
VSGPGSRTLGRRVRPRRAARSERYLDWDLPDPVGKTLEEIRPIRDAIDWRVRHLLEELVGTAA